MKRLKYQEIVKIVSEFLDKPDTNHIHKIGYVRLGKKRGRGMLNTIIRVELRRRFYKNSYNNLKEFKKKFKKFISKKENVNFINFEGTVKKIKKENETVLYFTKELGKYFLFFRHPMENPPLVGRNWDFDVYVSWERKYKVWELNDLEVTIEAL